MPRLTEEDFAGRIDSDNFDEYRRQRVDVRKEDSYEDEFDHQWRIGSSFRGHKLHIKYGDSGIDRQTFDADVCPLDRLRFEQENNRIHIVETTDTSNGYMKRIYLLVHGHGTGLMD